MRVFVFSVFGSVIPSIDQVRERLPPSSSIIAYNVTDLPYFMVAFDNPDDVYTNWCDHKDNDVPIYLDIHGVTLHS
jgi:hypothetical protein